MSSIILEHADEGVKAADYKLYSFFAKYINFLLNRGEMTRSDEDLYSLIILDGAVTINYKKKYESLRNACNLSCTLESSGKKLFFSIPRRTINLHQQLG